LSVNYQLSIINFHMPGNTFGKLLTLTTFGESHGIAVGGVLDGFPSNIPIDFAFIQSEVNRRKTAGDFFSSPRKEEDVIEYLSGIFDGRTTGTPISFLIHNYNQKPEDYNEYKDVFRPSHADYTYEKKYGNRDYRGGGRASARETLTWVVAGAFSKLLLREQGISIRGFVSQIGDCRIPDDFIVPDSFSPTSAITGCPDPETGKRILDLLSKLKAEGDTTGGIITCSIKGAPVGLGEPVFDKLQADLAKAMLSINAVKGFEYGSGFAGSAMKGSQHNDLFNLEDGKVSTLTNHSGGIQGGISNGEEIYFRVAFKPVSTIMKDQETITQKGEMTIMKGKGRHDVCVVPRAIPIVEAMAALVMADHLLRSQTSGSIARACLV
jgi:chorismate synthase